MEGTTNSNFIRADGSPVRYCDTTQDKELFTVSGLRVKVVEDRVWKGLSVLSFIWQGGNSGVLVKM